jgi:polynucleotide 5'-hydroxyl-kinase GRC3/NOL9
MSRIWADKTARQIIESGPPLEGTTLLLGATDTGKTSLAAALGKRLVRDGSVAVVDTDVGQSHIGPPTTVGWASMENTKDELVDLTPRGIAFVGDITPLGHLLQFTAAIIACTRSAAAVADVVLIDTPGVVQGPAASALWWTIQSILRPPRIVAIQRGDELARLLAGLQTGWSRIEQVTPAPRIPSKSPEQRRNHREHLFMRYFRGARVYNIALDDVAVRTMRTVAPEDALGHVVGLGDAGGADLAIGVIEDWQSAGRTVAVRAPELDPGQIRCLTVGDAKAHSTRGRS